MSGTSLVQYKPLTEAIDLQGNKYYTELSVEVLTKELSEKERISFSFSGDVIKSSHIVRHRKADPDEVIFAWKTQQLTYWQKLALEAWIQQFKEHHRHVKPVTENLIDRFIENIKNGKHPFNPNATNVN